MYYYNHCYFFSAKKQNKAISNTFQQDFTYCQVVVIVTNLANVNLKIKKKTI